MPFYANRFLDINRRLAVADEDNALSSPQEVLCMPMLASSSVLHGATRPRADASPRLTKPLFSLRDLQILSTAFVKLMFRK
jgi:hypothetical protein